MPKTKVSSKKKLASAKRDDPLPSLDQLKKRAAHENGVVEGDEEEEEDDVAATPSTIQRHPAAAKTNTKGLTNAQPKNLRDLFSEEDSAVFETITLDGNRGSATSQRSDRMDIFLRVRPLLAQELSRGENKGSFSIMPQGKGIALNPPVSSHLYRRLNNSQDGKVGYEFTRVLGDDLQQRDVFDITMLRPLQDFLSGTSQLIFTYGVTNSGKTYTLLGPRENPGILPRALERIFTALGHNVSEQCKYQPDRFEDIISLNGQAQREAKDRRENYLAQKVKQSAKDMPVSSLSLSSQSSQISQDSHGSQAPDSHGFFDYRPTSQAHVAAITDRECIDVDAQYEAWVSFVEIYDDVAYDLLDLNNTSSKTGRALRSGTLRITDEGDTCYAKGLIEVPVFSAADAYHVMGVGRKNLHVAATKLNEHSSRSHSIFTIKLVKISHNKEAMVTQLTFCDLAGTERANRTNNVGARLKESQNINKDLHYLKECIEALQKMRSAKPGRKKEMVPYRNCKLTRLFRSFFSGRGRASVIVNISQCVTDFDETVQAIRFGSSAMRIMIRMTKRESILIQPPQFHGRMTITNTNVISVQLEESMDAINESDEDEDEEDDENVPGPPSTVKKQPVSSRHRKQSTVVKSKAPLIASTAGNAQETAVKKTRIVSDNNSVTVIKGARRPTVGAVEDERCGRPLDDDSTSEDATSHGHNTDSEATFSVSSTGAEEDDEEDEYGEASEADLTLGGAVRGDRQIPDEFWEANCPFPEHLHEEDQRIRGLLLLLGHCQAQIKQGKALNMANEMKVRKELCDFYDKQQEKQAREFAKLMKRREQEFEQDRQRQEILLREDMTRKLLERDRADPSLMSFEVHEKEEEMEELRQRVAELEEEKRARQSAQKQSNHAA